MQNGFIWVLPLSSPGKRFFVEENKKNGAKKQGVLYNYFEGRISLFSLLIIRIWKGERSEQKN